MKQLIRALVCTVVCAGLTVVWADTAQPEGNAQLLQLWNQISQLKQSNSEIPAELYEQFFSLEQQLYPERVSRERGLDQGMDGCPGYLIEQPEQGLFDWVDYGQTYNLNNDCTFPQCRTGRDVIYQLNITQQDSLQITTCGSGFDTYLCIFAGACCGVGTQPTYSNDDSPICGPNSVRSAIRGCFQPGLYYIVVDGFNGTAQGHYQLNIQSLTGGTCGQNPELECPPDYVQHVELGDEGVCELGTTISCPARYCGVIGGLGDLDIFTFALESCARVTLSVWGNDTPGHSSSGHGLNPLLNLYTAGCESPIYTNDNVSGNPPDITGNDSRIVTLCLRPSTYWVEIGGNVTVGLYEFGYDCEFCEPSAPLGGVLRDNPGPGCLSWAAQPGSPTYYVWRLIPGESWELIATIPETTYCDHSGNADTAQYQVFTDPCGVPGAN